MAITDYGLSSYLNRNSDWAKQLQDQTAGFGDAGTGLTTEALYSNPNINTNPSFMDRVGGVLGNEGLMTGLLGAGQLGLGLASYLQSKPIYEEQLKAMRQNREIQGDRYNRFKASSDAFRNTSVENRVA